MRNFLIVFLVLALSCPAIGSLSEHGFIPFYSYLGTRLQGMAGSFVGIGGGTATLFSNPGELPFSSGIEVGIKDIDNMYGVQAYPTGYGITVGLSLIRHTSSLNNDQVRTSFSNLIVGAGFTLDRIFLLQNLDWAKRLGVGLSVKTILGQTLHQTGQPDRGATGFELDFGIGYKLNNWSNFGASLKNLLPAEYGGKINWDFEPAESVPYTLNIGLSADLMAAIKPLVHTKDIKIIMAPNYSYSQNKSSASLGLELSWLDFIFFRSGINPDGTSFGVGIRRDHFGGDISYYIDPETKDKDIYFSVSYFPEEWVFLKVPDYLEKDPVIITEPKDQIETYDEAIWIKGKIKPKISIKVNRQDVVIDENLNFAVQVPLNPGKNLILIDCHYQNRKVTFYRKVFRRSRVIVAEEIETTRKLKKAKTLEEREKLAKELKDIKDRKDKLEALVTIGVVEVDPDEEFKLRGTITRGELIKWIVKAAELPIEEIKEDLFVDVPRTHPLAPYIKSAITAGIVTGFPDNTFRPNRPVTDEEAEKIFAKFGTVK